MKSRPFFSIGVPTYNRNVLLRQCLRSILSQTFTNFEVIVGNNYVEAEVTGEAIGIEDPRILYINHEYNLGQFRNMNKLLELSRGRYFTWLSDDDLYTPIYLSSIHRCLIETEFPECVFTSYKFHQGIDKPAPDTWPKKDADYVLLSGREFVRKAMQKRILAIGSMGMFEHEYLCSIGGFEDVSEYDTSISLYGEYMLLIRAGLLPQVPYIGRPLMYFRHHASSWSADNTNVEVDQLKLRRQAGRNFVIKSAKILEKPPLKQDFAQNIKEVMLISIAGVASAVRISSQAWIKDIIPEIFSAKYFKLFKDPHLSKIAKKSYYHAIYCLFLELILFRTIKIVKKRIIEFILRVYNASSNKKYGRN